MALDPVLSNTLDAVGGLLVFALGIVAFIVRPQRAANRAFLLYGAGFGIAVVLVNFVTAENFTGARLVWLITGLAAAAGGFGIILMALAHMREASMARRLVAAVPAGAYYGALLVWDFLYQMPDLGLFRGMNLEAAIWFGHTYALGINFLIAATLYYVCLAGMAPATDGAGERTAVAASLWVYVALVIGVVHGLSPDLGLFMWFVYAGGVLAAVTWLFCWRGEQSKTGRNMALWLTGLPAAIGAISDWLGPSIYNEYGVFGAARALSVAIIAYAILRHQILGIDIKVRWTISRGTLAAIFIAVFVMAQTFVSEFFTDTEGLIGGTLAAGALVFFLSPLQRWADRFAGAATGDAKPFEKQGREQAKATYLATARAAWADGVMSLDERQLLDNLAAALSLPPDVARRIEGDVAQDQKAAN